LLRQKLDTLPGEAADDANKLVASEQLLREKFKSLRNATVKAMRIRHHGDYHLGQVLYTGDDFVIIDFEGEPARPLAERRAKTLAMRDVAGMIRSFSYAAYAGVFAHWAERSEDGANRQLAEKWAAFWIAWVGAEYLKAYFENAQGALFTDPDRQTQKLLLDVFLLQKALYETSYELNNRPDWVKIPLRGILSLIN
jgi:maltose alpha-D-glucosyltransferase/alpha-amylase